jgi:hypothetical protein
MTSTKAQQPEIIREHVFELVRVTHGYELALCVPKIWSNAEIEDWINHNYFKYLTPAFYGQLNYAIRELRPAGSRWHIRSEAEAQKIRSDQHERKQCDERPDFVHVVVTF